jgi:hypothetical protein
MELELDPLINKTTKEYLDKQFGDKDPELKKIMEMTLTLDADDEEDKEKMDKILNKMKKEHIKDTNMLEGMNFLIHDACGNLIPYKI